jgi:hypothetical protein
MDANELDNIIKPEEQHMEVGVRFLDNNWGAEAEWNHYEKVTGVIYIHDNDHGERVFSVIGEDIPGYFTWVLESDIIFIRGDKK